MSRRSPLITQYRSVWRLNAPHYTSLACLIQNTLHSPLPRPPNDDGGEHSHNHNKSAADAQTHDVIHLKADSSVVTLENVGAHDELFIAAFEGDVPTINRLLGELQVADCFPTLLDERGSSVLHHAASGPDAAVLLQQLVGMPGAKEWIAHKNSHGMTALMIACAAHNRRAVEILVSAVPFSYHINATSANGCTALHIAIDEGEGGIATFLVDAGASVLLRAAIDVDVARAAIHPAVAEIVARCGCTSVEYATMRQQLLSSYSGLTASEVMIKQALGAVTSASSSNGATVLSTAPRPGDEGLQTSSSDARLNASKKRAIADAILTEATGGSSSSSVAEIESMMNEMLHPLRVAHSDVLDVVQYVDSRRAGSMTVLSDSESVRGASSDREANRHTPESISHIEVFSADDTTASWSQLLDIIRSDGSAAGVAYLVGSYLHGKGTIPPSFRRLMNDMAISLLVSGDALQLVSECNTSPRSALFGGALGSSAESCGGLLIVADDVSTFVNRSSFGMWVVKESPSSASGGVRVVTFDAPLSIVRSVCEVTDASVVNFDESVAYCCMTRNRVALQKVAGLSGMIAFDSLFDGFFDELLYPISVARVVHPLAARRIDVLTHAIQRHCDAFVNFLLSSPCCTPGVHHLVSAARGGTAATFQILFSALGSEASLLSEVDDESGETPVTAAIACGTCLHLTSLLKLASRNLSHTNRQGYSPLMVACLSGNESAVLHLISMGANLNETSGHGMTPLIAAIAGPVDRIVMPLVRSGAVTTLVDANGLSPLQAAEYFGSSAVYPLLYEHTRTVEGSGDEAAPVVATTYPASWDRQSCVASEANKAVELIRALEWYFASLKSEYPQSLGDSSSSISTPVRAPSRDMNVQRHRIRHTPETTSLLVALQIMTADMSSVIRATLLEPHLFGADPQSTSKTEVVSALFSTMVRELEAVVRRFETSPPAEAPILVVEDTVLALQRACHAAHRFVAVVQAHLSSEGSPPHLLAANAIWQRALSGVPTASNTSIFVVPTFLLLQSMEATQPLLQDDHRLKEAITLMVDPCRSGVATVFDFAFAHQLLSEMSADGLSSLQYLLGCREVFMYGFDALSRIWLSRSISGYVVTIGPVGVSILAHSGTDTKEGGPGSISKRSYRDVASLLNRELSVLRNL